MLKSVKLLICCWNALGRWVNYWEGLVNGGDTATKWLRNGKNGHEMGQNGAKHEKIDVKLVPNAMTQGKLLGSG